MLGCWLLDAGVLVAGCCPPAPRLRRVSANAPRCWMSKRSEDRELRRTAGCWIADVASSAKTRSDRPGRLDSGYRAFLDAGGWMLDAGGWMLVAGCWWLDAGGWMLVAGCRMLVAGFWISERSEAATKRQGSGQGSRRGLLRLIRSSPAVSDSPERVEVLPSVSWSNCRTR